MRMAAEEEPWLLPRPLGPPPLAEALPLRHWPALHCQEGPDASQSGHGPPFCLLVPCSLPRFEGK
jgi:hypothetical protein